MRCVRAILKRWNRGAYARAADSASQWLQYPKVNKIYSSSLSWAAHHISGQNLSSSYPLLLVGERANDQVKVFLADFSNATDVTALYQGDPLAFDKIGALPESGQGQDLSDWQPSPLTF